jgi:hypothetical protein
MTVTQPEWVEALKKPAAYLLKSPKRIKLLETTTSYLFRADDWLYKIKKRVMSTRHYRSKKLFVVKNVLLANVLIQTGQWKSFRSLKIMASLNLEEQEEQQSSML